MEVAPGIHRIEGDLGERYVCQYLLLGAERTLLVDTGLRDMPHSVIAPYLADLGRSLADLDDVLVSHADVDHCGGNRALRAAAPTARLWCGEADRAWIESNAAMLAGNYRWYEQHGFGPAPEDVAFLERSRAQDAGAAAAVRDGLADGETDLWALTERADRRLGPYPEFKLELAASVRDHARRQGLEL